MGGLKTILLAMMLACALAAPPAAQTQAQAQAQPQAQGDIPADPLHFFATCAGRMSALMEHQWIVDGPASETTRMRRAAILDLVTALTPPGQEVQVMGWRVAAKAAHAALLARSRHGTASSSARAARQAVTLQDQCMAFLS